MPKEIDTLFHYCSLDTFLKIISKHTIRLFDISKSNDSLELIAFKDVLVQEIKNVYLNYLDEINSKVEELKSNPEEALAYIEQHKTCEERFKTIIRLMELESVTTTKTWGICFSEEGDLLSQWRGYADDGKGISIGFSKGYFSNLIDSIFLYSVINLKLGKVSYSLDEIKKIIYDETKLKSIDSESTYDEIFRILNDTCSITSKIGPFFKKPYFSEEKEWRLAISEFLPESVDKLKYLSFLKSKKIFPLEIKNLDYITKNGMLVSYIEIYLHNLKDAISKIIIGPKSKCTISEIKQFLIFYGLLADEDDDSIEIVKSESSYR